MNQLNELRNKVQKLEFENRNKVYILNYILFILKYFLLQIEVDKENGRLKETLSTKTDENELLKKQVERLSTENDQLLLNERK